MKNHVNQFVINAWRIFPAKCVLATIGLAMVSLNCTAAVQDQFAAIQEAKTIEVQGKDPTWNLVGTVAPMTGFQIRATGKVDFGGIFENDNANAGVTGDPFGRVAKAIWGVLEKLYDWLAQVAVSDPSQSSASSDSDPSDKSRRLITRSVTHWNWVDFINENGSTVNYDEGAFFVVITTSDQPPSKDNTANQVAAPALYYWYGKIYQGGKDIAYDKKVWVWAKVHDGGRDPFSTSSFHDNHGAYTISIDPDSQIAADALKTTSTPIRRISATGVRLTPSAAELVSSGKAHHVANILNRKTPNHRPK